MKANRRIALDHIFAHEGGYAERKEEGGGAVNMGITFDTYKAHMATQGLLDVTWEDLKKMPKSIAEAIYLKTYLQPIGFDDLPPGLDYAVLDGAILGGVSGSIKLLQISLGLTPVDGKFSPVVRWAANHRPLDILINIYCDNRLVKYETFKTWKTIAVKKTGRTWGEIWTDRIETVRKRALELANDH